MNTQHTLHQINLHAYNCWKRLLKEEFLESAMNEQQEIVSVDMSLATSVYSTNTTTLPLSCDSRELCELHDPSESGNTHTTITITIGDISIQADTNTSDEYLFRILKAVRHA